MVTDFKLTGLSKPFSMTCEPLDNENIFWPKVGMLKARFDALFEYRERAMIAEIEHDGLFANGIPKNPVVVGVRERD
jgi:hypothetical protein